MGLKNIKIIDLTSITLIKIYCFILDPIYEHSLDIGSFKFCALGDIKLTNFYSK